MATPLYKHLKTSGSTLYVLPGAAEDISSSFQNDNYKVRFTKFVLLKLKIADYKYTQTDGGLFNTISNEILTNNADKFTTSLRNYVANYETVIKNSLINNNNYYYNPNELNTVSEKIFWKWLKKIGGIEFEPANPNDEYIDSTEFQVDENTPVDYYKEYLWRERKSISYNISDITYIGIQTVDSVTVVNYQITFNTNTNFKPNDLIVLTNNGIIDIGIPQGESVTFKILNVSSDNDLRNNIINVDNLDLSSTPNTRYGMTWNNGATVAAKLNYDKTVQYVGEISSTNNVVLSNENITEILAFVPHQNGSTPDVLFRINEDLNYSPGVQFPILPTQDQAEIVGGELFDSPININSENYPGDQYAQFDNDLKYINESGLQDRRRGNYYGIPNGINRKQNRFAEAPYVWPEFNDANLDGVVLDFDINHYTKMNLRTQKSTNFDQFNAQSFNQLPPTDFEFNAVLWYYEVEDISALNKESSISSEVTTDETNTTITTTRTTTQTDVVSSTKTTKAVNLYGISILNGLDNEEFNENLRDIPTYKKLVTNGIQDGLSYQFSLNLNFNISNDNLPPTFDPNKIYTLYNFDLFNEVMNRLAITNDQFVNVIQDFVNIKTDVNNLKELVLTSTQLDTLNSRIDGLNSLLNTLKTIQITSTDSIKVATNTSTSPPSIQLTTIDPRFGNIFQNKVSSLFNAQTGVSSNNVVNVPEGKDFLITLINDDQFNTEISGDLNIVLSKDLDYKQTCMILIYPENGKYNKKIKFSIKTTVINSALYNIEEGYPLLENVDLPIDINLNENLSVESIFKRWNKIPSDFIVSKVNINQIADLYYLNLEINSLYANTLQLGDVITVENAFINYSEDEEAVDFSGQYIIATEIENNEIQILLPIDVARNVYDSIKTNTFQTTGKIAVSNEYLLQPVFISFNTGKKITIQNIDRVSTDINEKYAIQIEPYRKRLIS